MTLCLQSGANGTLRMPMLRRFLTGTIGQIRPFIHIRLHEPQAKLLPCQMVHTPITRKPAPATYESSFGLTYLEIMPPAATPIAEARIRAPEAPRNTAIRFPGDLDAKRSVASCVLSPSSARNTIPKTVAKTFKSIYSNSFVSFCTSAFTDSGCSKRKSSR